MTEYMNLSAAAGDLAASVEEFLAMRQAMIDLGGAKEPFDKEMIRVLAEMQNEVVDRAEAAIRKAKRRNFMTEKPVALPHNRISIEVYQHDWMPGFAAFNDDGWIAEAGRAHVTLNLGSLLSAVVTGDLQSKDLPYLIAESLMHEAIHALEAWADVEFSEDRVEELLTKYREKYERATIWEYTGAAPKSEPESGGTAQTATPSPTPSFRLVDGGLVDSERTTIYSGGVPGEDVDHTSNSVDGPVSLNEAQVQVCAEWAKDDRLWTTQETVAFNLRTFARTILAKLPAGTATPVETQWVMCLKCHQQVAGIIGKHECYNSVLNEEVMPNEGPAISNESTVHAVTGGQPSGERVGELPVTPVETASQEELEKQVDQRYKNFTARLPLIAVSKLQRGDFWREIAIQYAKNAQTLESQLTQVRSELDKTELDMVYWLRRGRAAEEKGEKLELALTQVAENKLHQGKIARQRDDLARCYEEIASLKSHLAFHHGAEAENKSLAATVNEMIALRQKFHKEGILSVSDGETFDALLEKLRTPKEPNGPEE